MKTFTISDEEHLAIHIWEAEHNRTCPYYDDGSQAYSKSGAAGGRETYTFTPTGLGTIVQIKCACGAEYDATDYHCW